jgi:hypothetical protein
MATQNGENDCLTFDFAHKSFHCDTNMNKFKSIAYQLPIAVVANRSDIYVLAVTIRAVPI